MFLMLFYCHVDVLTTMVFLFASNFYKFTKSQVFIELKVGSRSQAVTYAQQVLLSENVNSARWRHGYYRLDHY